MEHKNNTSKGKTSIPLVTKAKNVFYFKKKNNMPSSGNAEENVKAAEPLTLPNQISRTQSGAARRRLTIFNPTSSFHEDGAKAVPYQSFVSQKAQHDKGAKVGLVCGYSSLSTPGESLLHENKKVNQDCHLEISSYCGDEQSFYFAVMDGHGIFGHIVSKMIKDRLSTILGLELHKNATIRSAIETAFQKMNYEVINSSIDCNLSGSTSTVVLLRNKLLLTANVGDSRAVLGQFRDGKWIAKPLSIDHKPDRIDEWNRIVASGGRVEPMYYDDGEAAGPPRVWVANSLIPGLAMSRSIGDTVAASVGVTAEPEIIEHMLTPADKFIILGTDGIWEFISNSEAVTFVSQYVLLKDHKKAADALAKEAHSRWHRSEGLSDDITCTIVFFNPKL